ncbi:hypothetical protein Mapa_014656 [Marchantia paleacea]|nr:hypothetical protein Mapa_014656 [Marchantia paleacea]
MTIHLDARCIQPTMDGMKGFLIYCWITNACLPTTSLLLSLFSFYLSLWEVGDTEHKITSQREGERDS